MLPGRGKLFKQHHPQHPLLLLYRPVPLVPCPCCYCTTGVGGEVRAIFAVAGVWTGNDPPCPPILRDGEGIVRVVEAVPTASLDRRSRSCCPPLSGCAALQLTLVNNQ